MALEDIRKRLFRKKESFEEREGEPELPPFLQSGPRSWTTRKTPEDIEQLEKTQRAHRNRLMFWITIATACFLVVAGIIAFLFLGRATVVSKENIYLEIEAPQKITVGEQVTFEVLFQNKNKIPLESVDLIFEYPDGARPVFGELPKGKFRERRPIGRLLSGEEKREVFQAILFGKEGDVLHAEATLEYRPQNSSARFGKDATLAITVERSPMGVVVSLPGEVTAGQEVEVVVDYVSTTQTMLQNVSLDVAYPDGFEFISASPEPSRENNFWRIGDIPSGGTGSIHIRGKIGGAPQESRVFHVQVGLFDEGSTNWSIYGQASGATKLRDTFLAIELTADDTPGNVVEAGKSITYKVRWRNNLPVSVRNVIIRATITGDAVDYARVNVREGSYDGANKTVVWNASTVAKFGFLEAGDSGVLSFSVPILPQLPIHSLNDKNLEVSVDAAMLTNTIPTGFDGVEVSGKAAHVAKIATQLGFVSRGYHRSGVIQNSGPLPPRVGQETTYAITWSLTTSSNDLENSIVHAAVPAYVRWKDIINPVGEKVTFDPDKGEIVWNAGFVVAGTGYTRPAREVSFQVSIIPGINHVESTPQLISTAFVAATDVFTRRQEMEQAAQVTTSLRSDPQVTSNEYKVIQ